MRRTMLLAVIVLGLLGSASAGTAQSKSERKEIRWKGSVFRSNCQGKGKFSFILYNDSKYREEWEVNCLGYWVRGHARGAYKLVGSDFSYEASGYARLLDGRSSSWLTVKGSGKILGTKGSGTYRILYDDEKWPSERSGTWEVEKVE
ncbi:MAG: hypothetical protein RX316_05580 [bacterium]|nr:hypothetical protein [bacterium]